jgi:hypothetical protein
MDPNTLALDLLAALGKNPQSLHRDNLRDPWQRAHVWVDALGVEEILVDRAHSLGVRHLTALAELAGPERRI